MNDIENKVLNLIKRDPEELSFVISSPTYEAYIQTYLDTKLALNDVVYNKEEYKLLRSYFVENKEPESTSKEPTRTIEDPLGINDELNELK